jgi:carboxyl-terminal processing protease
VANRVLTLCLLLLAAATVRTESPLTSSLGLLGSMDGVPPGFLGSGGDAEEEDGEYRLSSLRLLNRTVLHIKEQYVDPRRVLPREMLVAALEAVEKQVAEVVVDATHGPDSVMVSVGAESRSFGIKGVDSLWELSFKLRDVFKFLEPRLPPDQDKKDVEYAAVNGMLSTLDPHSVLMSPPSFDDMKMTTSGEFGGLGIVIGVRDGALTIISPMDGTPASAAGLEAKDTIVRIGDESTVNMALDDAVKRLRGKPGTQVTIWILRRSWTEPRRFVITRDIIKIVNVTHKLLDDHVGYVKVKNFQQETAGDVKDAMRKMVAQGGAPLAGLILDLRNNPGGLLEQAVDLSDLFLDSGVIVTTVGEGNRIREEKTARWAGTERDVPLVVLVNPGSASASEIVAGAVKNNDRALVAGSTTFGKGSVQTLLNFKDASALKLTIAQYLTPGDVSIQSIGITPDVEVVAITVGKDYVDMFPDKGGARERDLDKHLDDTRAQADVPSIVLRHLEAPPKEDEEPEPRDDKFRSDFEIDFARRVLQGAGPLGKTRKGLLASAQRVSTAIMADEEDKAVAALKVLGVDWTAMAPLEPAPPVKVSARVVGSVVGVAGETLELKLEVTNEGTSPLYRLRATTESDDGLFQDREFVFGKLAPGEKRDWAVKVKVPKDAVSRADDIKVTFNEDRERVPAPLSIRGHLQERPRPSFSFSAFLDDTAGNGDGLLNPGESAELAVSVTNLGPGPAEEPLVLLKNLGGRELFIRDGRAKLDKLGPGQTVTSRVSFDAQADVKRQVEMRLSVLDSAMAEYLAVKLAYPVVDPTPAPLKVEPQVATAVQDLGLVASASPAATVVARVKKGTRLAVERTVGEFARVDLGEGRYVFAPVSQLKLSQAKELPRVPPPSLTMVDVRRAPELTVVSPLPGLATAEATALLSATVADPQGARDALVFVNDQKVLYRALGGAGQVKGGQVVSQFDAVLPLKKGTNVVSVIARVDNETAARRTLIIHREGVPETASRGLSIPPHRRR